MDAIFTAGSDLIKFYLLKYINTGDRMYDDALRLFCMTIVAFVIVYLKQIPGWLISIYEYFFSNKEPSGHFLSRCEIERCNRNPDVSKWVLVGFANEREAVVKICKAVEEKYPYPDLYDEGEQRKDVWVSSIKELEMKSQNDKGEFSINGKFNLFPVYICGKDYVYIDNINGGGYPPHLVFCLRSPHKRPISLFISKLFPESEVAGTLLVSGYNDKEISLQYRDMRHMYFSDKSLVYSLLDKFLCGSLGGKLRSNNLSLLLYGPPGTGKTLLAKCIASHLKRNLRFVNSGTITTRGTLINILTDRESVVLFDEFDFLLERCLNQKNFFESQLDIQQRMLASLVGSNDGESKKSIIEKIAAIGKAKEDEVTLDSFLCLLDGAYEPEGRVIIATTNHIDKIDSTLFRPGRFRKIFMGPLDTKNIQTMLQDHYDLTEPVKETFPDDVWTPAEITQMIETFPVKETIEQLKKPKKT